MGFTLLIAGGLASGCATGETDPLSSELETKPAPRRDGGNTPHQMPEASTPSPQDASADSGGDPDATVDGDGDVDAGHDSGPVGGECPTLNATRSKACGLCGQAVSRCVDDGFGSTKWSEYGPCAGEVVGGCTPGSVQSNPCGTCGVVSQTCSASCTFSGGTCVEPASCTTGFLVVPGAVGSKASTLFSLSEAKTGTRVRGDCPVTTEPLVGPFTTQFIEVKNVNAKPATVTLYVTQAPGGPLLDTTMVAYAGTTMPASAAAQKACSFGVSDTSESSIDLTGFVDFPALTAVRIPAGASVMVYVASFSSVSAGPAKTTGTLKLNVRTDILN